MVSNSFLFMDIVYLYAFVCASDLKLLCFCVCMHRLFTHPTHYSLDMLLYLKNCTSANPNVSQYNTIQQYRKEEELGG